MLSQSIDVAGWKMCRQLNELVSKDKSRSQTKSVGTHQYSYQVKHKLRYTIRTYIGLLSSFLKTENENVSFTKFTLYLALDCWNWLLAVGTSNGTSNRATDGSYTYASRHNSNACSTSMQPFTLMCNLSSPSNVILTQSLSRLCPNADVCWCFLVKQPRIPTSVFWKGASTT